MYFHYFVIISPRKKEGPFIFIYTPSPMVQTQMIIDQQCIWQNKYVLEN